MSVKTIQNYLSLVKFSHTIFALPFAMIGFFYGIEKGGEFSLKLFLLVLGCMVFARSAAMAFNRFIDRRIDEANPRTATREIPAGIISANSALGFIFLSSAAFMACAFFINKLCFFLSPVALMVILGYSLTKRFTSLCHFVLGLGLSLAPLGAYIAVTNEFALVPVLFSLSVLFWVGGFDIIYALQDEEFDRTQGLRSVPERMGRKGALFLSRIIHFFPPLFLSAAGYLGDFGTIYWSGVLFFTAMIIYQHSLVKPNDLSKVNLAFFTVNGIASVTFSVFVLTDLFI